eukprot:939904-Ditylum_brightwellii.AAC.1
MQLSINEVYIHVTYGSKVLLQRVEVSKILKTLGVRQAGTQQMIMEFEQQLGKMYKFGCALIACALKQHECYLSYRGVYIPSITYDFAASSFTVA